MVRDRERSRMDDRAPRWFGSRRRRRSSMVAYLQLRLDSTLRRKGPGPDRLPRSPKVRSRVGWHESATAYTPWHDHGDQPRPSGAGTTRAAARRMRRMVEVVGTESPSRSRCQANGDRGSRASSPPPRYRRKRRCRCPRLSPYSAAAAVTDDCVVTILRTATRCVDTRPTATHVPTHQSPISRHLCRELRHSRRSHFPRVVPCLGDLVSLPTTPFSGPGTDEISADSA